MAKIYLEKLNQLTSDIGIRQDITVPIEIRHFFSGAALYANGKICVSWSPAGLAFKLPAAQVEDLIASGAAKPLKYFEKGYVKKGYAVFDCQDCPDPGKWKRLFLKAVQQTG